MNKLSADDHWELRYLMKRGPTYPRADPGSDEQLDRLASLGLIERQAGLWRITPAGRAILEDRDNG